MINYVYTKVNKLASARSVTVLLFLSLLLMVIINTLNMPVSVPRISELSNGAGILDMKLYYTSGEAYQLLERLQPDGRSVYMKLLLVFDFVFPFLYTLSLVLIVTVTFRYAFQSTTNLQKLCLMPLLAGLCDWIENICVLTMLAKYPKFSNVAYISGYFTLGKWVFILLSLILIAVGMVFAIRRSRKEK